MAAQATAKTDNIKILIGAMRLAVRQCETHQQAVNAQHAAEGFNDGDRAAAADHDRGFAIFLAHGGQGGGDELAVGRYLHAGGVAEMLEGQCGISGHMGAHMRRKSFSNQRRVLAGHQAEAHFRAGFRGNHGLAARSLIAAPDTVDIRRRPRPEALKRRAVALAAGQAEADLAQRGGFVKTKTGPARGLFG